MKIIHKGVQMRLLNSNVSKEMLFDAVKKWNSDIDKNLYCEYGSPVVIDQSRYDRFVTWLPELCVVKIIGIHELEDTFEFDVELLQTPFMEDCNRMLEKKTVSLVPRCMGNADELIVCGFDIAMIPSHYVDYK